MSTLIKCHIVGNHMSRLICFTVYTDETKINDTHLLASNLGPDKYFLALKCRYFLTHRFNMCFVELKRVPTTYVLVEKLEK